ncbi:16227_t:CDS:2 [Cetraspora pellucida]|uniref:16227_t:CDS:1 n=1 Tax=Cetraspora pellucida TaxID=1433469 RepID=A0A9N9EPC9_9GLOM|nr:16227_t:CDS:2 [Cetraspora pellucida]
MALNNSLNSYNPLDDTINTIVTGLVPLLIVGFFKCFEEQKLKQRYFIILGGDYDLLSIHSLSYMINYVSSYCVEYFGIKRCNDLNTSSVVIYFTCIGISLIYLAFYLAPRIGMKKFYQNINNLREKWVYDYLLIPNYIVIIILTVYPAIVSGYLLSTNSLTTKIVFAISSISLSRLVEHFGDKNQEDIIVNYEKDEQDPKERLIYQINRLKSIQEQESKLFEEVIEELQNLQG